MEQASRKLAHCWKNCLYTTKRTKERCRAILFERTKDHCVMPYSKLYLQNSSELLDGLHHGYLVTSPFLSRFGCHWGWNTQWRPLRQNEESSRLRLPQAAVPRITQFPSPYRLPCHTIYRISNHADLYLVSRKKILRMRAYQKPGRVGMESRIMTQIHVAAMLPHIAACVIQFHLTTSIARWMLTRMTTERVQRSPRLELSITLFLYAR